MKSKEVNLALALTDGSIYRLNAQHPEDSHAQVLMIEETTHLTDFAAHPIYTVHCDNGAKYKIPYHMVKWTQVK